jgi:beta-galactosidase
MSRDQTIFVDDDGTGYHFYSSRDNYDMRLHTMTDDFLDATEEDTMILETGGHREAPAIFKYNNTYYLITSGCTGWDPNEARYDITENIWQQPWIKKGNPCIGSGAERTFEGQSTFVLKVHGYDGAFIFIADIWNTGNLAESRYIWLPIRIKSDGDIEIE